MQKACGAGKALTIVIATLLMATGCGSEAEAQDVDAVHIEGSLGFTDSLGSTHAADPAGDALFVVWHPVYLVKNSADGFVDLVDMDIDFASTILPSGRTLDLVEKSTGTEVEVFRTSDVLEPFARLLGLPPDGDSYLCGPPTGELPKVVGEFRQGTTSGLLEDQALLPVGCQLVLPPASEEQRPGGDGS